jgi:hypothetical protein
MSGPRRYQRTRLPAGKRTPDQSPPKGARYCGRPGPFGNPWVIVREGRRWAVRNPQEDTSVGVFDTWEAACRAAQWQYRAHLDQHAELRDQIRRELAGVEALTCWCHLPAPGEPDPCHVAVIIDVLRRAS